MRHTHRLIPSPSPVILSEAKERRSSESKTYKDPSSSHRAGLLRMTWPVFLGLVIACAIVAPAVLRGRPSGKDEGPVARLSEAPPEARRLRNPFAGQAQAAAAGRKLFVQHCSECHGSRAEGLGKSPSLHLGAIQSAPPGALFWAIRNGRLRRGMPSWAHLPDAEIWQMVTYLKTLGERPHDQDSEDHKARTTKEVSKTTH